MQSDDDRKTTGARERHSQKRFAYVPKRMQNGKWIWLQHYLRSGHSMR
ncbi:MAG TPA: hypothetical protein VF503_18100 [Sphingobium sp.]